MLINIAVIASQFVRMLFVDFSPFFLKKKKTIISMAGRLA